MVDGLLNLGLYFFSSAHQYNSGSTHSWSINLFKYNIKLNNLSVYFSHELNKVSILTNMCIFEVYIYNKK